MNIPITAIVPVYNSEQTVALCIECLKNQSLSYFECIVVDDGSTDESAALCRSSCTDDPRFTFVQQEHLGTSAARNAGLDFAQGKAIAFVDADDVVPVDGFAQLMDVWSDDVDLAVGSFARIRHDGADKICGHGRMSRRTLQPPIPVEAVSPAYNLNTPWGKLYRRSVIEQHGLRFEEGVVQGEDRRFNLQFCSRMKGALEMTEACVYHYREGGYSTNQRYIPDIAELYLETFRKSERYLQELDPTDERWQTGYDYLQRCIQTRFASAVEHYCKHLGRQQAVEKIAEAVELYRQPLEEYGAWPCPWALKPWERMALGREWFGVLEAAVEARMRVRG